MTRDEFEKLAQEMMEAEHLRRVAIVSGFDTVEFFSGEVAAKQAALLAAHDEMAKRIAELEAACERALEGLRAPTHAANDHNCEDWPPGQGCRGCDGNELRKAVAGEIAALLRGER